MPSLYREACIHFPIHDQLPKTIESSSLNLSMLMHLGIEFSCFDLGNQIIDAEIKRYKEVEQRRAGMGIYLAGAVDEEDNNYIVGSDGEDTDQQIAACINTIATQCLLLRNFTLHLLSNCISGEEFLRDSLDNVASRAKHTAEALRTLKVRDTISFIAVASNEVDSGAIYINIRQVIALLEEWKTVEL